MYIANSLNSLVYIEVTETEVGQFMQYSNVYSTWLPFTCLHRINFQEN
jgi:hypothetical protein